jgi:hypothetical protein
MGDYVHERPRSNGKRVRHHDTCNWEFLDFKNNDQCNKIEYGAGYCKEHYFIVTRRTIKKCTISLCGNDVCSFGDGFCYQCGMNNGRAICIACKERGVWSNKSQYCESDDPKLKCVYRKCKSRATKEWYNKYYCNDHYPEKKTCCFVIERHGVGYKKCKAKWYSNVVGFVGNDGKCRHHSNVSKIRIRGNGNEFKYTGVCNEIIEVKASGSYNTTRKCARRVSSKNMYCSSHKKME